MSDGNPCCTPSREGNGTHPAKEPSLPLSPDAGSTEGMVRIDGGAFRMGAEGPECWAADGEGPRREVSLDPYFLDCTAVTNEAFAAFVEATGYQSEAERFGWSFVFHNQIPKSHLKRIRFDRAFGIEWWAKVEGACWRKPGGPGTNIRKRMDHPVVHVSWHDARAFCQWTGKRLPTEAEWERAARGGEEDRIYPWGDELTPGGKHRCNIWQGRFPEEDTGADGYTGTAPARSFPSNPFGLYNMMGNAWDWVTDWFDPRYPKDAPTNNPLGPAGGSERVIRGGSFLCHESYCNRYRNSARTKVTPDSTTCHLSFRCAMDDRE